jgi:hypothetical protein
MGGVARTMNGPWRRTLACAALALSLIATAGTVLAQTAALIPNAKQQYLNALGQPLVGGFVYSFVPNTTVPKTTWSDPNEAFPNSQPVVLDAGGGAFIFGQGNYRQQVFDANNNLIWDGFTSAAGSAQVAGSSGTDTAPVGSIMPFSGFVVPTNWQLAFGQALSRANFPALLSALTISTAVGGCSTGGFNITGWTSTVQIPVGSPIESTCFPTGTTVVSITNATTIVVSQAGTATGSFLTTAFPWGNGDASTTFNVPDLRGRVTAGADCLGSTLQSGAGCASRLTAAFFGGTGAQAPGLAGGSQSIAISQANLPNVSFNISGIALNDPQHSHGVTDPTHKHNVSVFNAASNGTNIQGTNSVTSGGTNTTGVTSASTGVTINNALTGITIASQGSAASGGSGTAFSQVPPTLTVSYIIKVAPNSSGSGGVTSLGGMFGDIVCGAGLTCANGVIAAGVSSTALANTVFAGPTSGPAAVPTFRALTNNDLAFSSTTVNGVTCTLGSTCAITATAASITIASTTVLGGTSAFLLFNNAGVLGNEQFATLAQGGTNAALVASNGGIIWSDASKLNVLAGTVTANQCLLSGSLSAPTWGSCVGGSTVSSMNNADASLTLTGTGSGPFTGAVTAKINLANPNVWTARQSVITSGSGLLLSNNAAATALTNQGIDVVEDSVPGSITLTTYGVNGLTNMPTFVGQTARGSLAAPAVVQANDVLASFSGRGYIGGSFAVAGRAFLRALATETWSAGANGAYWSFATTPTGTTNTTEVLRIENDGGMTVPATVTGGDKGLGSINVGSLFISGTAVTLPLTLANGGTNNALTASNGGVVYSDASKLNVLAGTVTAGQCLLSGSSTAPTWGSCSAGSTVASVGNAAGPDTSLTITGTGSGPFTGAVTAKINLANAQTWTAAQTFSANTLKMLGSSTGVTTLSSANAGGSNFTITVPAVTDALAVLATNQTFSATQTFSGILNVTGTFEINGTPVALGKFTAAASVISMLSQGIL